MIKRHCTQLIKSSLSYFPAVLVIGARQVGKSTIAQQLVTDGVIEQYVTLDDLTNLQAATADPDGFLGRFQNRVAIDEIQRVPDLMRALKKKIDENRQPGKFLLTGSANILNYRKVGESLAGRLDIIHLEGFSFREILGQTMPSDFLQQAFSEKNFLNFLNKLNNIIPIKLFSKEKLREMIFFGGFPEIQIKKDNIFLQRWFSAYQTAYIERDVRDISRLIDIFNFGKLINLCALQTGNLLNTSNMAQAIGVDIRTLQKYLNVLELTFQIRELQPWHQNIRKRLIKSSKIFLYDSALACFLYGIQSSENLMVHPFFGALLETWFFAELRKLAVFTPGITISFYRTYKGKEVDFVLEKGNRAIALELKSASTVSNKDFYSLKEFQENYVGECFCFVVYTGDEIVSFSNTCAAIPIQCVLSGSNGLSF